jgi:hypothetical protein
MALYLDFGGGFEHPVLPTTRPQALSSLPRTPFSG